MDLKDSLLILGLDPSAHFMMMARCTRQERIRLASSVLDEARKRARALMAQHHPDRGGSPRKFQIINDAIIFLERNTEEFIEKMNEKIEDSREKAESRVLITSR